MSNNSLDHLLRKHFIVFALVNAVLFLIDRVAGGGWWSFWLIYAWGIVLAVHFFYVRSVNVDERWVEERADDVRLRSYDVSHIEDINARINDNDLSVRPSDRRESPGRDPDGR